MQVGISSVIKSPSNSVSLADTFLKISKHIMNIRGSTCGPDDYCRFIQVKEKYGKNQNKIFFPLNWLKLEPYQQNSFLNRGIFTSYWGRFDAFYRFLAIDHGQYPWGRNRRLGTMAALSRSLKVNPKSCNTCLTIHVIIGLLQNDVITVNDLLKYHRCILFNYLNSTVMRDADTAIPILLHSMNLADTNALL